MRIIPPDLAAYSSDKPEKDLRILFVHHACGAPLLADKGDEKEAGKGANTFVSHPYGGGLRTALTKNNYLVAESPHEAIPDTENHTLGMNGFSSHLPDLMVSGQKNDIIVLKLCFHGKLTGLPETGQQNGRLLEKSFAGRKEVFLSLLPALRKYQDTLFVVFTPPPLMRPSFGIRQDILNALKALLGKPDHLDALAGRIRYFNNWLKDMDSGWLKDYGCMNVVVFDYFDILTDYGSSDWCMYPARKSGFPNSSGNTRAAQAFIPFLNKAVRRAGLLPSI